MSSGKFSRRYTHIPYRHVSNDKQVRTLYSSILLRRLGEIGYEKQQIKRGDHPLNLASDTSPERRSYWPCIETFEQVELPRRIKATLGHHTCSLSRCLYYIKYSKPNGPEPFAKRNPLFSLQSSSHLQVGQFLHTESALVTMVLHD